MYIQRKSPHTTHQCGLTLRTQKKHFYFQKFMDEWLDGLIYGWIGAHLIKMFYDWLNARENISLDNRVARRGGQSDEWMIQYPYLVVLAVSCHDSPNRKEPVRMHSTHVVACVRQVVSHDHTEHQEVQTK